jgi:hypothetical protein
VGLREPGLQTVDGDAGLDPKGSRRGGHGHDLGSPPSPGDHQRLPAQRRIVVLVHRGAE